MNVFLLGTYEMGRQPFGLASPAAWLREAGFDVELCDVSRQRLDLAAVARARLVACYLPMHTATRLLPPIVARVREVNPHATLCAFGLYAPLNAAHLRDLGFDVVLGPEFEGDLSALCARLAAGEPAAGPVSPLPRLPFRVPDRTGLPALSEYASLHVGTERRVVGYTEATRGCKHRCRHCPIVPVYDGRFRVVPLDVVVEDVRRQVAQGARHITFGDPDFFNGPRHAIAIVEAIARTCPGTSYDVTIKVEHLLQHASLLPRLTETGCLFVTSAVESLDDDVLRRLEKGHTRADVGRAVGLCRAAGLTLVPTFVAFTPWTSVAGYRDLLHDIAALGLVDAVASVQLTIRLLIPEGSRLLELEDVRRLAGPFDRRALVYPWKHLDPAVDDLQRAVTAHVGRRLRRCRREVFSELWALAHAIEPLERGSIVPFPPGMVPERADVPWLDEPWYC